MGTLNVRDLRTKPAQKPDDWEEFQKSAAVWPFTGNRKIRKLDLRGISTAGETNMRRMFNECARLEELDLSGFDTSCVTAMSGMFNGCRRLKRINLSSFDTSHVETMWGMFHRCESLRELDLSGFDTSNVTDMTTMFRDCRSLRKLNVSGFDTASVGSMTEMLRGCEHLTRLDLSSFTFADGVSAELMLSGCARLQELYLPENLRMQPEFELRQKLCVPAYTRILYGAPSDAKRSGCPADAKLLKRQARKEKREILFKRYNRFCSKYKNTFEPLGLGAVVALAVSVVLYGIIRFFK